MERTVSIVKTGIIFGATGIQEIDQNIRTIVSTILSTVPLDRGFGIDTVTLDGPLNAVTQARMTDKIVNAIREYEKRVEVLSVKYVTDGIKGRLIPMVKYRVKEGVTIE